MAIVALKVGYISFHVTVRAWPGASWQCCSWGSAVLTAGSNQRLHQARSPAPCSGPAYDLLCHHGLLFLQADGHSPSASVGRPSSWQADPTVCTPGTGGSAGMAHSQSSPGPSIYYQDV